LAGVEFTRPTLVDRLLEMAGKGGLPRACDSFH
jgi:hypothetical protein